MGVHRPAWMSWARSASPPEKDEIMVSIHSTGMFDGVRRRRQSVPWLYVGLLAVLMAYADGFVVKALQGATGAIERSQHPFSSWLWHSTLLLPVFALAVVAVLAWAYRRYGPE